MRIWEFETLRRRDTSWLTLWSAVYQLMAIQLKFTQLRRTYRILLRNFGEHDFVTLKATLFRSVHPFCDRSYKKDKTNYCKHCKGY